MSSTIVICRRGEPTFAVMSEALVQRPLGRLDDREFEVVITYLRVGQRGSETDEHLVVELPAEMVR